MLPVSRCRIPSFPCGLFFLLVVRLSFAQLVAAKDLSQPTLLSTKTSSPTIEKKYCNPSGGISDGIDVDYPRTKLNLSISRAELNMLNGELTIATTMRLKNDGDESTSIPWSTSPVEPIKLSEDGQSKTSGYEVATIDFYFGHPHTTNSSLTLRGQAALWSQPGNLTQRIRLHPGEWIELKFRPKVLCSTGDATSCLRRLQVDKLQISAWWYQRLLTTTMREGCLFANGAYTQNEIDSSATQILSALPQASQPIKATPIEEPKSHE